VICVIYPPHTHTPYKYIIYMHLGVYYTSAVCVHLNSKRKTETQIERERERTMPWDDEQYNIDRQGQSQKVSGRIFHHIWFLYRSPSARPQRQLRRRNVYNCINKTHHAQRPLRVASLRQATAYNGII